MKTVTDTKGSLYARGRVSERCSPLALFEFITLEKPLILNIPIFNVSTVEGE